MINLGDFMDALTAWFLDMYMWTDSIYPFADYPISLFWLFESTILANIAWQLFPHELADAFESDDDDSAPIYYKDDFESDSGYYDFKYGRSYDD